MVEEGQKSPGSRVFVVHCDVRWKCVYMKEDGVFTHNARFECVDRAAIKKEKTYARRISGRKARARKVPGSKVCARRISG